MHRAFKKQKGVALLEVLVAVMILSIGFLATSRMQIMGMRFNQGAFFKTQASVMSADMADRMRVNLSGVESGQYDSIDTSTGQTDPGCMTTGCSPTELAQLDAWQWSQSIKNTLPDATGTVTNDNNIFEIEVQWKEKISNTEETLSVKVWLNP
jgi:type IV pilus assembly protein PilV